MPPDAGAVGKQGCEREKSGSWAKILGVDWRPHRFFPHQCANVAVNRFGLESGGPVRAGPRNYFSVYAPDGSGSSRASAAWRASALSRIPTASDAMVRRREVTRKLMRSMAAFGLSGCVRVLLRRAGRRTVLAR